MEKNIWCYGTKNDLGKHHVNTLKSYGNSWDVMQCHMVEIISAIRVCKLADISSGKENLQLP